MSVAIRTLHLTNGSAIIGKMQEAGIEGAIVPWNDLLHEGPVPTGLGTTALREVRAAFLAGCGWGSFQDILRDLEQRDRALDGGRPDEIVLWFEHDLFDQLQLIQILDRLPVDGSVRLTAVMPDTYLGEIPAASYGDLLTGRRVITSAEQLAARDAWQAFRSSDPRDIVAAIPRITALPHLAPALHRHMQQFPSRINGLSRTEHYALDAVASGITRLRDVYVAANHHREQATFMGDAGFLFHISPLFDSQAGLLRTTDGTTAWVASSPEALERSVALTDAGKRAIDGRLDRVVHCGIDRWLGGVHLQGHGPVWRWDDDRRTVRLM